MPLAAAVPLREKAKRKPPQELPLCKDKNQISAEDAQSKAEGILNGQFLGNAVFHTSITFTLVTRPSGLKVLSVLASR